MLYYTTWAYILISPTHLSVAMIVPPGEVLESASVWEAVFFMAFVVLN